jgi:D-alanine-D-alanine ligase
MEKRTIAILCGGASAEHEVSLRSARTIAAALDPARYQVLIIGITKAGVWFLLPDTHAFLTTTSSSFTEPQGQLVAFIPGRQGALYTLASGTVITTVDVVFPVLHGPHGEDGTVQGLLELAGVPFVGAGVLGSAVGMDKDVMKRLLREAGLPIGDFLSTTKHRLPTFESVVARFGAPFFVKPANLGSSVGVSKVHTAEEYLAKTALAFTYDSKILIEKAIDGRELECAVLGGEPPQASIVGEIRSTHDFYSYDAKYTDQNGAVITIPAEIPAAAAEQVRALSVRVFQVLCCAGLGRVDFFLKKDGEVLINEINTLPGFTSISMYPKLWEASGIPLTELVGRLVELVLPRPKS